MSQSWQVEADTGENWPGRQNWHIVELARGEKVPAPQFVQELAFPSENCPGRQPWQAVRPSEPAKNPPGQPMQGSSGAVANVPLGQRPHWLDPIRATEQGEHPVAPKEGENDPAGHSWQVRFRSNVPGGQARQETLPFWAVMVPGGHRTQLDSPCPPVRFRNVWSGHGRQLLALAEIPYVPAGQGRHCEEPEEEKVPSEQFPQKVWPTPENVPDGHARQLRPCSNVPALHATQANAVPAPGMGLVVPDGHGMQSERSPRCGWSRYVWAGHSKQAVDPAGAYRPSAHVRQPSAPSKLNSPGPHVSHVLAAHSEYCPPRHQSQGVVLPVTLLAVPGMQPAQSRSSTSEQKTQPE